jgi:MinD-like ATPase involved in chromosome partitioning or flagellar assembly
MKARAVFMNKIIAVYGNSGGYKTAVSVELAKTISQYDKNADIAVIGLDCTKPLIPLLFPNSKSNISLGRILSAESLDQDVILKNVEMNGQIGVIAYNAGENYNSYAFPTDGRIDDFLTQMRHLVNYTIIDCTSDVARDKLTAKTLINADNVLYLISADINGLAFYYSQEPILQSEQYGYNGYLKFLTVSGKFTEDIDAVKNSVLGVNGVIPYSAEISGQWNKGDAFKPLGDGKYNKIIGEIADVLTEAEI